MRLLERERELAAVEQTLGRAREGRGGMLAVQGPAGAGKTALLRAAGEAAAGATVLRARGSELERAYAFGLARALVEHELARDPALLAGGAELAPVGGAAAPDLFAAIHGLYWLVVALAERGPVVILADDLHWADEPSLRFLAFLAGRLEDLPVALLVAFRPGEPGAHEDLLDALSGELVRPAPLSAAAAASFVRARLGPIEDALAAACHRATGGNPFLLGELVGELDAEGERDPARVLELGHAPVARAIRRRLRALGPDAEALARALAVLGPGARLDEAAAVAGLADAAGAADALTAVELLAPGLEFVHPLVLTAIYEQIPPHERDALHVRAAEAAPERAALHLLRVSPAGDPARVRTLRAAAAQVPAGAAVRYLQRALEEPPPAAERGALLHELGRAEATDRRPFEAHLRAALAATGGAGARGAIALDLGRALAASGEFRASVEVFDAALRDLDGDGSLGVRLEAELLTIAFNDFTAAPIAAPRWEHRLGQLARGERLDPLLEACLGMALVTSRPPAAPGIVLAEHALEAQLDEHNSVVAGCIGNALAFGGRLKLAGAFYDGTIAAARRRGDRLSLSWQLVLRAQVSLRLGEVRRAESEARTGLELVQAGSGAAAFAWAHAHLIEALVARGAHDEADALAPRDGPPSFPQATYRCARSRLRLAQGNAVAALAEARAAGAILGRIVSNPAASAWRSDAALALAGLGRRDEARALAESEFADARRFAVAEAEGIALRTLGMVTYDIEALRAAVKVLEPSEARFEHARSLLELGAAQRRAGLRVESRETLRSALDQTARIGASALADRAHAELVTAGARPRRERRLLSGRESLTASEDRVAALAAEGLTNREIAQKLFVTPKAVQWHLRNVYRKLDLSSREALSETLGGGG